MRGVLALLVTFGVTVACGGRSDRSDVRGGSAGASGRGGTSSPGGTGGVVTGGVGGIAGTVSLPLGGASSPGGTSAGGTQTCRCEGLDCAPGYYREPDAELCCGAPCLLDCRELGCPDIDLSCRAGMHLGTLPGECCESCVPDSPASCEDAKNLYQQFRAQVLAKYWSPDCNLTGCAVAMEYNRCAANRVQFVSAVAREAIEDELSRYAEAICSACPQSESPVSLPLPPISCNVTGDCSFDVPG